MLGSIGTFESFGEESGSTYPKAGSRAIKYTVFCSPPFNKSPGMQCVSLRVVKAGNWACYVGAAPSYCDTSKGLNKYLGFAIDGTVRFQKAKIQSSSSDRKYADGEELCLCPMSSSSPPCPTSTAKSSQRAPPPDGPLNWPQARKAP